MNRKGIAFSIDALFAVTIILVALLFLYSMQSQVPSGSEQAVEFVYQQVSDTSMVSFYKNQEPSNPGGTFEHIVCVNRYDVENGLQDKTFCGAIG
ncbi:MAG TPA: hypothetical protein VJK05_06140 [archaeon]|nr:hypothetical protein [archaeon]